jgi:hypothetical protein
MIDEVFRSDRCKEQGKKRIHPILKAPFVFKLSIAFFVG